MGPLGGLGNPETVAPDPAMFEVAAGVFSPNVGAQLKQFAAGLHSVATAPAAGATMPVYEESSPGVGAVRMATIPTGGGGLGATLDTDGTMAANSDVKVASQKATRTYVATAIAGKADSSAMTTLLAAKADASAVTTSLAAKTDKAANLSDLASVSTARTNLGVYAPTIVAVANNTVRTGTAQPNNITYTQLTAQGANSITNPVAAARVLDVTVLVVCDAKALDTTANASYGLDWLVEVSIDGGAWAALNPADSRVMTFPSNATNTHTSSLIVQRRLVMTIGASATRTIDTRVSYALDGSVAAPAAGLIQYSQPSTRIDGIIL